VLTWKVKIYDVNKRAIVDHDVLKYRLELIKTLKKKCASRNDFYEALKRDFRWQYWCRSEYELILSVNKDRIILGSLSKIILKGQTVWFLIGRDITDEVKLEQEKLMMGKKRIKEDLKMKK
jgi:hypothetical protein